MSLNFFMGPIIDNKIVKLEEKKLEIESEKWEMVKETQSLEEQLKQDKLKLQIAEVQAQRKN